MKVEIDISEEIIEPYAVIHTNSLTQEIQNAIKSLESKESIITAIENERLLVLDAKDIYMVRMENSEVIIYCQNKKYTSKKRLYEIGNQLGVGFMQISKAALINLKQIDCVEPSFNGIMNLRLKNGCTELISRKYLPAFKNYLGI